MLLVSVWWGWYLWQESNDMIYVMGYVIKFMIHTYLSLDHDHEPVHPSSASEYLFGDWFYASGGFDP